MISEKEPRRLPTLGSAEPVFPISIQSLARSATKKCGVVYLTPTGSTLRMVPRGTSPETSTNCESTWVPVLPA